MVKEIRATVILDELHGWKSGEGKHTGQQVDCKEGKRVLQILTKLPILKLNFLFIASLVMLAIS